MIRSLFLIGIFICSVVHAQPDTVTLQKVNALKSLFADFSYQPVVFNDTSLAFLQQVSALEKIENFPDRSTYLAKRAEQLRTDLGLELAGSYVENFNLDPVVDLEENISYRRRVQMGMQWDILDNGYFENQVRAQMIDDQLQREKLFNDLAKENQYYLYRFDQTVYCFNLFKIKLLNDRLTALEKERSLIRDLVFLKKLKKEVLIELDIKLSEIESLIHIYESYNNYLAIEKPIVSTDFTSLPLIDLNYEVIFKSIGIQTDSLLANHQYKTYLKWYHEVGLRPFVRYNYYDMLVLENRSYVSAGINLSVPLRFNTQLNNEVEHEKWLYENQRFSEDRAKLHEEVLNTVYDFSKDMKRFVDHYQQRKLMNERLRIEKVKMRIRQLYPEPLEGLALYDQLIEQDVEMMEILQGMYLNALKIQAKIPGVKVTEMIRPQDVTEMYTADQSAKKRAVYVWSSTFDEYPADFLAEYSIYNEFNKVIVSASPSDTSAVKKEFMQYAKLSGDLYFMLGSNRLFYNKNIEAYLKELLTTYKNNLPTGIHLDIEPHTFENWDTNREELLKQYVSLVSQVKSFCSLHDFKLEISVPKHYGEPVMTQLYELADQVYFMCYENVDTDFLVRKLSPYTEKYPNKTVIALRTEDFVNRLEMEDKIEDLQEKLNIHAFAYHDLKRMIDFDKRRKN